MPILSVVNIYVCWTPFAVMQLLEAAWCMTNIAAGKPEETKELLPALPLLIAHLGGWWLQCLF